MYMNISLFKHLALIFVHFLGARAGRHHVHCVEETEANLSPLVQLFTVCPRSSDPFYIVTYYIKWVTTLQYFIS